MKLKYAISILVIGYCCDFVGELLKIMHYAGAEALLMTGTILKVGGAMLTLYKLVTHPRLKGFMDE